MRYSGLIHIGITAAAVGLAGCGTSLKHNDVLLFGTQTKLALDVSAAPENAGMPEFTFGFKRKEFVWMPLLANGTDTVVLEKAQAQSNIETAKYVGSAGENDKDTYSVLASFGADFRGGGSQGKVEGGGGLAQYFATGIAARLLAAKGGADLVAIRTPSGEAVKQATKRADAADENAKAAEARTAALASFVGLTPDEVTVATQIGEVTGERNKAERTLVLVRIMPNGVFDAAAKADLRAALQKAEGIDDVTKGVIGSAETREDLERQLRLNPLPAQKLFGVLFEAKPLED